MLNKIKELWTSVKQWFNWSWSIFLARLEVLAGILIGALGGVDWYSITQLDFSDGFKNKNTLIVAGILIVKGIISEIGRRAGTVTTVNDQLVPANIAADKKIAVKK